MGIRLFDRRCEVIVGTRKVDALRVDFRISKTLKPTPNQGEIKLYNLSPETIKYLSENEKLPVQINAGYKEGMSTIFLGEMRTGGAFKNGRTADRVSTLFCVDSEKGLKTARISKSYSPATPPDTILRDIARALQVGEGNINQAVLKIKSAGLGRAFSSGTVVYGSAELEMTRVCRSFGLEWSVQDGKLQVLELGKALEDQAIELATEPVNTGVIDTLNVDAKGVLQMTTLIIPDVFPGRKIVVRGDSTQGQYIIQQTTHMGSTNAEGEWRIDIEGKRY